MQLRLYPDPILRKQTTDISVERAGEFSEIAEQMLTILQASGTGVGLAANQVGLEESIIVVSHNGDRVFLNPKVIDKSSDTSTDYEGCLSFPDVGGFIIRPATVTVEYMTTGGKTKTETLSGMVARIVQHEIDHINGINIIDVMSKNELRKNKRALKALEKAAKRKRQ